MMDNKLTEDQWYDYATSCFHMDYYHPSGFRYCDKKLIRHEPPNKPLYGACDKQENCPNLKNKRMPCDGVCHNCDELKC